MSEYIGEYVVSLTPKTFTDLRFHRHEEIVRCRDCRFKDEPWNCAAPYYVELDGFCAWGREELVNDGGGEAMNTEKWWRLKAPWDTLYYAEQKLKELGESAEWLALVEEVACGTRLTADEAWGGMADALRAYLDGIGSERVTSDGQSPQKRGLRDADRAREADTADVGEAARDEMPGMLRGGGADGRALHGGALLVRQDAPLRGPDGRRMPEGGAVLRVKHGK